MEWNYKREEPKFEVLPEGKYRVRVKSVDKAVSQNGNDMFVIKLEVSGSKKILFHYIVFMPQKPEITNGKLTQFFSSFKDIDEGNLDTQSWVGKVGAVVIKHEEYNGEKRERISYFIRADKQDDLPAWVEPENGGMTALGEDEDLPF